MIKSIIFSSTFHILLILTLLFNISKTNYKQPQQTKEIKVNVIEQKIYNKPKPKKRKIKTKPKTAEKPKKTKPKIIPKLKKIERKKRLKNEVPKKTIINKKPSKKKKIIKKEPKTIKKLKKEIKKPKNIKPLIHDIKEYKEVDDFGISDREKANLKFQITHCYQESKKGFNKLNIDVSVNIKVLPNGIINYKNMIFTNQIELSKINPEILQKITKSISKTLKDCSPLRNLPEDTYDIWKRMNIKFKY